MSDLRIAVLGAGVVGLTTAVELQRALRGAHVSVLADRFTRDTTSHVAAGLFRPGTSFCGPSDQLTRQWIGDSYNHWEGIWRSSEGALAGVTQLSGYIFSNTDRALVENHLIDKVVPLYRSATEEELQLCPGDWKYGSFFTTTLTECDLYLPWVTNKFKMQGGKIVNQKIHSFSDVPKEFNVIVNCTGLGAKYLCNDHKLVPIRGQVIKVNAPFIKTFFYGEYDTYIIPGFKGVSLGGCRQYDSYDLKISRHDSAAIKERCEALVPSLRSATLIKECVGLRPHRDPVRVEKQIVNCNGRSLKIVHNYGHGGYGVTTAPGTALYAVKLTKELLAGNSKM